ncbi:Late embryogenesis abundant protein, LEA-14 [Spatholobus suberectus]|nr:Late embryogenesis abundant protein, LEA-14 [Spatholobus suberectus]
MHHAKTDSEVTSLAASSPTRSPPRRPLYYVQSPSRDSHDGEKTATTSFHSTPVLSPVASPPHSRHSSSTRLSKKDPSHGLKPWKPIDVIEEEGLLLQGDDRHNALPRRCYFLAFVVGFLLLFSLFSLILWGASRPMKPKISIKSIKFDHVRVQAGSDSTGVATDMITMNSTLKFTYRNTGTFFGVHVTATPVELSYSKIVIASGNMKRFYQSRRSQKLVSVAVMGDKIPLYGSGASLSSTTGVPTMPVPLNLNFVLRSRAYVLGKLVKPKYYKTIQCSITLDPKKLNAPVSLKKSCTYE